MDEQVDSDSIAPKRGRGDGGGDDSGAEPKKQRTGVDEFKSDASKRLWNIHLKKLEERRKAGDLPLLPKRPLVRRSRPEVSKPGTLPLLKNYTPVHLRDDQTVTPRRRGEWFKEMQEKANRRELPAYIARKVFSAPDPDSEFDPPRYEEQEEEVEEEMDEEDAALYACEENIYEDDTNVFEEETGNDTNVHEDENGEEEEYGEEEYPEDEQDEDNFPDPDAVDNNDAENMFGAQEEQYAEGEEDYGEGELAETEDALGLPDDMEGGENFDELMNEDDEEYVESQLYSEAEENVENGEQDEAYVENENEDEYAEQEEGDDEEIEESGEGQAENEIENAEQETADEEAEADEDIEAEPEEDEDEEED